MTNTANMPTPKVPDVTVRIRYASGTPRGETGVCIEGCFGPDAILTMLDTVQEAIERLTLFHEDYLSAWAEGMSARQGL